MNNTSPTIAIQPHSLTRLLTHSLTDHSCKARDQKKQYMATILRHNNKLTTFWNFDECGTLYLGAFHLPFSCSPSCQNHIKVLIFCPYLDATTLFKAFVFTATCIVILEPVTLLYLQHTSYI